MTQITIAIDDASSALIQNYLDVLNQNTGKSVTMEQFLEQKFTPSIQSICNQAAALPTPKAAPVTIAVKVDATPGAPVSVADKITP